MCVREIDYVVIACVRLSETLDFEYSLRVKVLITLVAVTFSTEIGVLASSIVKLQLGRELSKAKHIVSSDKRSVGIFSRVSGSSRCWYPRLSILAIRGVGILYRELGYKRR